ncbi:Pentatricopeptide repeat-containing protein At1g20230 [Linum perenne]
MLAQGVLPDGHVLPSVIKAAAGLSSFQTGTQVHCLSCVNGYDSDSLILSSLVHLYLKCDRLMEARKVFDKIPQPNVVACSALLSGYARKGRVDETKELLCKATELGLQLNLVSWNGMITGFNHSRQYSDAVLMFRNMHSEGFKPDGTSISSVLPAVRGVEMLCWGIQIHGCIIKQGLGQDNWVVSSLVDMYGKCARPKDMSKVCEEMRDMDVISWTSMIASCSQNGKDMEALELFREMQMEGIKPNSVTIPCLLPACGNIAALMHGKATHCFSLRNGFFYDIYVSSALLDMYAKCGRIYLSRRCFDMMPTRNRVSWNALLGGYAMHGKTKEALNVFQLMQKSGQEPDFISFTSVLSACCHGGLTEEGRSYFDSMSRDYEIEPKMEHYSCMVNLLGRAGRLAEAYTMVKQMPFEADGCIWGPLLSACRVHNNLAIGEVAAHKLFELEPTNPGNYVLLSNIYASKSMWVEVDMVRERMKSEGLKKNPGCSWIEIKNKVHMLLAGDKSHPQMPEITKKLAEVRMEMQKSGYLPHTDFVLQDVEEHDKEEMLCDHSEKLAVALGLVNTSSGFPLQVIKNLRICGDCHVVIKFISSFEKREIFVRDTNLFHHFKDGTCSCGDYW